VIAVVVAAAITAALFGAIAPRSPRIARAAHARIAALMPAPAPDRERAVAGARSAVKRWHHRRVDKGDALLRDLAPTVDLLAVAASAGCNVRLALEAVCRARDGPSTNALRAALHDTAAGGDRLADALARLPTACGEPLRPLCALLVDAERYGSPLAPALERLGADLRDRSRRRSETRVRRLPVRMLLPLVGCVLPAFALLTVAPLLLSGVRALTSHPPLPRPPTPHYLPIREAPP
jgi:type II secretory pathway component PulF